MKRTYEMSARAYERWAHERGKKAPLLKDMRAYLKEHGRSVESFRKGDSIEGVNRMNSYQYTLAAAPVRTATQLHTTFSLTSGKMVKFAPYVHPRDMLRLGVFSGKMINDCLAEFPKEWFEKAIAAKRLSPSRASIECNKYKRQTGQTLAQWREQGFLFGDDERGWFQWYCRYALGRRDPEIDAQQMSRWRPIARWHGKLKNNPDQITYRQILLHWSWPHDVEVR